MLTHLYNTSSTQSLNVQINSKQPIHFPLIPACMHTGINITPEINFPQPCPQKSKSKLPQCTPEHQELISLAHDTLSHSQVSVEQLLSGSAWQTDDRGIRAKHDLLQQLRFARAILGRDSIGVERLHHAGTALSFALITMA